MAVKVYGVQHIDLIIYYEMIAMIILVDSYHFI